MAINVNIPSQIKEYDNFASFPATGSVKTLYVAKDNNKLYRWTGTAYVEVSTTAATSWGSITGTLSSQSDLQTALDSKVNTEVGKGLSTNDYTNTEKSKLAGIQSGAEVNVNADWNATSGDAEILNKPTIPSIAGLATVTYVDTQDATKQDALVSGTNIKTIEGQSILGSGNIDLTKSDVGLANVDNTSDANKPISTATQTALNAKQDTLVSGTSIKTVNSTSLLGSGDVSVGVTSVSGTSPISSTGGATPAISIATANTTTTGALSSTDWNTFNNKQSALTLTTTGTSGAATLVGSTLNVPQYSGGSSNPSVISLSAVDGTAVAGTIVDTLSRSLLIPANTFTGNGMLEIVGRVFKTGAAGGQTVRIYKNTSSSLTGATLIGIFLSVSSSIFAQAIRTFRINSNTLTGFPTSTIATTDYASNGNPQVSTTFTTSVDNYIIFSIQLANSSDSSVIEMARAVKYV